MSDLYVQLMGAVQAVAPVTNLFIGDSNDRSTWQAGFSDAVTDDQRAAAAKVLVTWSPIVAPRTMPGAAILTALTDDQAAKVKLRDLLRVAVQDAVPVTKGAVQRIAEKIGSTPDALSDKAASV